MSKGINKFIGIGNAGTDPEIRNTPSGSMVANLSIAVNEQWKDKSTGQKKERTEWIRVAFFGRLAEIVGEYVTKGMPIYVEGRIQTDKFQDKQTGQYRYSTKIICHEMQMLGGRGNQAPQQQRPTAPQHQPPQQNYQQASQHSSYAQSDTLDDDIPF